MSTDKWMDAETRLWYLQKEEREKNIKKEREENIRQYEALYKKWEQEDKNELKNSDVS